MPLWVYIRISVRYSGQNTIHSVLERKSQQNMYFVLSMIDTFSMTEDIKNKLLMCAEIYHCAGFIESDPVQFPHRYTLKQDIEISGLLTAIMSFGNRSRYGRKQRVTWINGRFALPICIIMPLEGRFPCGAKNSFYRMLSYDDFLWIFSAFVYSLPALTPV